MGLFGGSSSSSSTTNNYVDNSSITANQAGALLGIAGDSNTVGSVNVLDGGVINRAFEFAGKAGSRAFEFAESSNTKLTKAVNDTLGFAERAGNNAMRIAFESSQPGTATMNKQMIGFGILVASTVAAFVFMNRGK